LGRLEEFPNKDFDTAIELYDHQLRLNPIHREALERMVACHFFLERYQSAVDKLTALSHFHGDRASPRLAMIIAKCQAALYENQRQYSRALVVYEARINALDPDEQALYHDLTLVATPDDAAYYLTLSEIEKAVYRRTFWAGRDPDPTSGVNERLVEHYRRGMYARENFSLAVQLWDRRGPIYIRYGEPDDRQRATLRATEELV